MQLVIPYKFAITILLMSDFYNLVVNILFTVDFYEYTLYYLILLQRFWLSWYIIAQGYDRVYNFEGTFQSLLSR